MKKLLCLALLLLVGLPAFSQVALAAAPGAIPVPGDTPDYFGPYSNWANSPLPSGSIAAITIVSGGTGYTAPTVTITDVYRAAPVPTTATVDWPVRSPQSRYLRGTFTAPVVNITDPTGSGASATATITPAAGTGLRKFMDALPNLVFATPDVVTYPGSDYYEIELGEYDTWQFHTDLINPTKQRGYRQTNNGTNVYSATNTGGCGAPPASHTCTAADNTVTPPATFSYLGPSIIAVKDRPTRIKFTNNLPVTGAGGNLFIPTDTTVMGAGPGYDPATASTATYPQNRGTLHLHGGFTPWISDGTPHQWVTPANEGGNLKTGVSTQHVPDMPIPAGDSMTFYYPNQQSGRLMFYHDHAYGITRLNVYAGEAAGYLLVDPVERATDRRERDVHSAWDPRFRTFRWSSRTRRSCGARRRWCRRGVVTVPGTWHLGHGSDLELGTDPRESLVPARLHAEPEPVGHQRAPTRWAGGTTRCGSGLRTRACWRTGRSRTPTTAPHAPWEPPHDPRDAESVPGAGSVHGHADRQRQGVSRRSTCPAGPVRFRILNAANDRFWNLSLFVAADKTTPTTAGDQRRLDHAVCTGRWLSANCTEVKMVPFNSSQNAITPFPIVVVHPGAQLHVR